MNTNPIVIEELNRRIINLEFVAEGQHNSFMSYTSIANKYEEDYEETISSINILKQALEELEK